MKHLTIIKTTNRCAFLLAFIFTLSNPVSANHEPGQAAHNQAPVPKPTPEMWIPASAVHSDWFPYGESTVQTDWSPVIKGQTKDFTQAITYKQVFRRLEQKRERSSTTGKLRNAGKPTYAFENRIAKNTRKVSVYPGTKTDTVKRATSDWFPASDKQTKEYLQGRTYSQMQEQVIEYYSNGKLLDTVFATPSKDNMDEMRTVTVIIGDWTPKSDGQNCSGWQPKPSHPDDIREILQSRTCTQKEERVTTHHANDAIVHSYSESRINKKAKQERYVRANEAYSDY